jgi:hypothetical protein
LDFTFTVHNEAEKMTFRIFKISVGMVLLGALACKHSQAAVVDTNSGLKEAQAVIASPIGTEPSKDSCNFYLAQEATRQCVHHRDKKSDYLTQYGYYYCNLFLYGDLPNRSVKLADFLVNVRFCLQNKLSAFGPGGDCQDLDKFAFDSHVSCYVESKFCEVSLLDQLAVARAVAGFNILPRSIESAAQFAKIQKACASPGLSVISLALSEIRRRHNALSTNDYVKVDEIFARAMENESQIGAFFGKLLARLGIAALVSGTDSNAGLFLSENNADLTDAQFREAIANFHKEM